MVEEKKERIILGWKRKKGGYGKVKERGWCGMIRVTWVDEETTTV